jgi:hypothetical protein
MKKNMAAVLISHNYVGYVPLPSNIHKDMDFLHENPPCVDHFQGETHGFP